jgi:hypothetical protein
MGLNNSEIGGIASHLDVAADGSLLYMSVGTLDSNFSNPTGKLKGYDLESGSLWTAALSSSSEMIVDVATCPDGSVVVADQTMNAAGLRVFKDTMEVTTAALPFGLPPGFGNNLICYDVGAP